jgi:hypothetical protein
MYAWPSSSTNTVGSMFSPDEFGVLSLMSGPPLASVNGPSGLLPTATPMFIQPGPLPLTDVYQ